MLFLGGGGSASDESRLWAEAFPARSRVAVLPYAQSGGAAQRATAAWMITELDRLGDHAVAVVRDESDLAEADVVAVPGGNTFLLLSELRKRRLTDPIQRFLLRGGSLYGGSAGAVLAGADIDIAAVADANEVDLRDTRGLDLLVGADVLPHFSAAWDEFAHRRAAERDQPVICIPERAGVVVDGAWARNTGPEDVRVVTPTRDATIGAGESWDLRAR